MLVTIRWGGGGGYHKYYIGKRTNFRRTLRETSCKTAGHNGRGRKWKRTQRIGLENRVLHVFVDGVLDRTRRHSNAVLNRKDFEFFYSSSRRACSRGINVTRRRHRVRSASFLRRFKRSVYAPRVRSVCERSGGLLRKYRAGRAFKRNFSPLVSHSPQPSNQTGPLTAARKNTSYIAGCPFPPWVRHV